MIFRFLAGSLLICLWQSSALALAKDEPATMMGLGASNCTDFANAYRINQQRAESSYFNWAQGFMTGMNLAIAGLSTPEHPFKVRDFKSMPMDEQRKNIREYCHDHPLADYYEAVMNVYGRLHAIPAPPND
ncbi:MAG TPA: hypothetical protein VFT64_04325 [Rickettsiales bacterium]|nr:hypothetical protein [Rickettsiales bacterium]